MKRKMLIAVLMLTVIGCSADEPAPDAVTDTASDAPAPVATTAATATTTIEATTTTTASCDEYLQRLNAEWTVLESYLDDAFGYLLTAPLRVTTEQDHIDTLVGHATRAPQSIEDIEALGPPPEELQQSHRITVQAVDAIEAALLDAAAAIQTLDEEELDQADASVNVAHSLLDNAASQARRCP